jgi:tape measure domain-containing protein
MNRAYELMIRLQDLVSPQMLKLAGTYGKVIGTMERKKSAIGNIFSTAGQSVDSLRRKILGLPATSRLRVDTSEVDTATRKVSRLKDEMGKLPSGGGGSGGISGMFGRAMRGSALGGMLLGGIGGYMGMQALETANNTFIQPAFRSERNQFSTGVMLGDQTKGKALMDQLAKYAADNPVFDKPEVQAAGQLLVGVNEQLQKIIPRLSMFGDVAAGSGNDLIGLTTILAKIKAQGKVQGDEMMQLMERRINILPALASVKGVRQGDITKLISKGLVSYEDVIAAFAKMTGDGGMYHNMGNRIANETQGGKYQKVLGDLSEKAEQIGMKLLPYVTKIMDFVGQLISNMAPLEKGFSIFSNAVGEAWLYVSSLLKDLGIIKDQGSAVTLIMETLGTVFTFLGNAIKIVTIVLKYFTDNPLLMFLTGMAAIPSLIGLVSSAWVALNVAFAATPIGFIITAVVGLVAALMTAYDKVDWFREGFITLWETVKTVFSNIGDFLKMIWSGNFAGALAVIGRTMSEAGNNSVKAVKADRNSRIVAGIPKPAQGGGLLGGGAGGSGGGGLGGSTGLSSTVGNSKSQNITINVNSLIAKSEITVMDFAGDISELESKVVEALYRLINSANQIAVS